MELQQFLSPIMGEIWGGARRYAASAGELVCPLQGLYQLFRAFFLHRQRGRGRRTPDQAGIRCPGTAGPTTADQRDRRQAVRFTRDREDPFKTPVSEARCQKSPRGGNQGRGNYIPKARGSAHQHSTGYRINDISTLFPLFGGCGISLEAR